MDKNIPLSELIRIGCKVSKFQCRGLFRKDGSTCAIGAAHLAKTGELVPIGNIAMNLNMVALEICGADPLQQVYHPMCQEKVTLIEAIITLNDNYNWPREKIADWLDSIGL